MLKNYFKVMVRNLLKRKGFALINLFGLATGMAVCILLVMYIQNELGYDSSYKNADRIYRLGLERKYTTRSAYLGHIPRGIPKAIKTEFPEVLQVTRMAPEDPGGLTIIVGEKNFIEKNVISVDTNFFSVFSAKFLQGDVSSALQKPHTIVVNESTAKRFFGSAENAIGKKIEIERSGPLVVTAVFKDWPEKSHFHADILIPSFDWDRGDPEYIYFGPYTYLLLDKNASAKALEAKLPLVVEKYVAPKVGPLFGESFKDFVAEGNGYRYFLQPIKDIHLHSTLDDEITPTVSIGTIRMFGAIAVFILFLACVNFINLSTALSVERAREVGIRKTFGSQKSALILQFLSESVFFSLASMILALAFVSLLVPFFNKISGTHLSYTYFLHPWNLFFVVLLSVVIGVLAGLYPSLVLSSFEPMIVLKGRFKSNRRGLLLRNGLVIFQFAVSVILIICTIVVNRQMQFMLGEELGYKKDNIVYVDKLYSLVSWTNETGLVDKRQAFVDELSQIPGVNVISKCDGMPGTDDSQGGATWLCIENNNSRTEKVQMVDDNYAKLLGLQIKEGRFFFQGICY